MAILVYRIEGRGDASLSPLRRHVRGQFSKRTLDLPDIHLATYGWPGGAMALRPSATPLEMRQWRQTAMDCRTRGKPPEPWCEALLAGAKIIDWHPTTARHWAEACLAEYERLFPLAKIVEAQLHSRETQWHVHIIAQPRGIDHKGRLRCSKNAMLRQGAHIATGRELPVGGVAYQPVHRSDCSAMQDAFYRACGKPFGLGRGERGSEARNKKIDDVERAKATAEELAELLRRESVVERLTAVRKLRLANKRIAELEAEVEAEQSKREDAERQTRYANHKRERAEAEVNALREELAKHKPPLPPKPKLHDYRVKPLAEIEGTVAGIQRQYTQMVREDREREDREREDREREDREREDRKREDRKRGGRGGR